MRRSIAIALAVTLLTPLAQAKDKEKKVLLPPSFLTARTVAVIIDPNAGIAPNDPNANRTAQKDVETALEKWGRFEPIMDDGRADLVIIVRKGSGKVATGTIADPRQNSRPGSVTQTDDGTIISAQPGRGRPPTGSGSDGPLGPASSTGGPNYPGGQSAHPEVEMGNTDDSFIVEDRDGIRWRYDAKDALHHQDVPAVDRFRKVFEEAEKAGANASPKKQPASAGQPSSGAGSNSGSNP